METSWIMEEIFPHVALAVWGKSMWSFPGMEDVLWDRSAEIHLRAGQSCSVGSGE